MPVRKRNVPTASTNNTNSNTTIDEEDSSGDTNSSSASPTSCGSYTKLDKQEEEEKTNDKKIVSSSSFPTTTTVLVPNTATITTTTTTMTTTTTTILSSKLKLLSQKVKQFLTGYAVFTTNAYNQDKILKVLQFSLWWIARFYTNRGEKGSQSQIEGSSSFSSSWSRHYHSGSAARDHDITMGESLNKLSNQISWARYVTRLLGLPTSIEAVSSGSFGGGKGIISKLLAWSMVAYYPLENLAWTKWQAPALRILPSERRHRHNHQQASGTSTTTTTTIEYIPRDESKLASRVSAWSCRFWTLYIIVDIIRSTLALQELIQLKSENLNDNNNKDKDKDKDKDDIDDTAQQQRQRQQQQQQQRQEAIRNQLKKSERLQILRNMLFLFPAIHWSLPKWDTEPWLSDDLAQGLMWLESVVCLYQGISNFRGVPSPSS